MWNEKEFALRLAKLRMKKKVSAREMSLDIGQNPGYINHIESGQGIASLPAFFNICEYLGVTPAEFFDYETEDPAKLSSIHELLKKLDYRQLNILEGLIQNMIK